MSVDISLSNDEKYFFVSSSSYDSGETFYFTEDDEELKLIKPMEKDVLYHVYHHHDKFILLTNKDGCKNFKLMITNIEGKSDDNIWTEFIPYDENIYIKDLTEHRDFLLIEYKEKGINKVKVLNYKTVNMISITCIKLPWMNQHVPITSMFIIWEFTIQIKYG